MRPMLSVEDALAIVLRAAVALPPEDVPLEAAVGRALAAEVRADRDYPPFAKSLMDGYAVVAADLRRVPRPLRVVDEIAAGRDPGSLRPIASGEAARIMTGAPLPPGADAVVMVEETALDPDDAGTVVARAGARSGDHLAPRGSDARAGEPLLARGALVGAAEIAVLATCGAWRVRVGGRPHVAVLSTGDELVGPGEEPGPGTIRNSNGPLMLALARRAGAAAEDLGIARDDPGPLRRALERGLGADVLAISGGVSMGTRDLVAPALADLGVRLAFDAVAIKPGKPFTFGTRGRTLIFACPGNPVSSQVIFEVFVRPALRALMGFAAPARPTARGVLRGDLRQKAGRAGYYQARAGFADGRLVVETVRTSGSADFAAAARGNALAIVPADVTALRSGDQVDVLLLDDHRDR